MAAAGNAFSPPVLRVLYSWESHKWPNVGRYKVDVSSLESLALPELEVKEDTDLFIIDEVDKKELFSSSFFPAVLRVIESNIPLLASAPFPKSGRDISGAARLKNHPGATIYTLNTSNRDAMKTNMLQLGRLVAKLLAPLQKLKLPTLQLSATPFEPVEDS